ncbi:hypothetical protein VpasPP24_46 [Vibrio phage Vpas_PP24]|nr:hypothetical protein VpasPP24_46 [Vibrio phage Vpas_PP24]
MRIVSLKVLKELMTKDSSEILTTHGGGQFEVTPKEAEAALSIIAIEGKGSNKPLVDMFSDNSNAFGIILNKARAKLVSTPNKPKPTTE